MNAGQGGQAPPPVRFQFYRSAAHGKAAPRVIAAARQVKSEEERDWNRLEMTVRLEQSSRHRAADAPGLGVGLPFQVKFCGFLAGQCDFDARGDGRMQVPESDEKPGSHRA